MKVNLNYFELQTPIIQASGLPLALINIGQQRGIHPDKLLKGTQLFYDDLKTNNKLISQQQWVNLVANGQKLIKQNDLSFMLGRQLFNLLPTNLKLSSHHCHHLAQLLQLVSQYQQTICPYLFITTQNHQNNSYWLLNHAISVEHQQYQIFMFELFASCLVNVIKMQFGRISQGLTIRLPYKQPKYIEQYQSYLAVDCQFIANPGFNAMQICMNKKLLFRRFNQADNQLLQHHLAQLPKPEAKIGLLQSVHSIIEKQISQQGYATLEHTAEQLNISVATLKRKLSQHNTSFQRLFDHNRQQKAIFQLTEQRLSNEKVAQDLNFNDLTNFRRAIKRWTGMTPSSLKRLCHYNSTGKLAGLNPSSGALVNILRCHTRER